MAAVTVELRKLLETDFELFDFDYQFDDLTFKKELEEHVIQYFWDYEIGQETPDMFKRKFRARWLRCIGYYNTLYNTTLLQYNPLTNYSLNEAMEQLSETNSQSQSNSTGTSSSVHNTVTNGEDTGSESGSGQTNEKASDYPQHSITAGNYLSGEKVGTYSDSKTNSHYSETNVDDSGSISNENNQELESKEEAKTTYQKTIEGITGVTYQDLIKKQRDLIIRIPDMVCEELKPCFVLVY